MAKKWEKALAVAVAVPTLVTVPLMLAGVTRDEALTLLYELGIVGWLRSVLALIGLAWLAGWSVTAWVSWYGERRTPVGWNLTVQEVLKREAWVALAALALATAGHIIGAAYVTSERDVFVLAGIPEQRLALGYSKTVSLEVRVSGSEECIGEEDRVLGIALAVLQDLGIEEIEERQASGYPQLIMSTHSTVARSGGGLPILCSGSFSIMLEGTGTRSGHHWHHWSSTYRGDEFETEYIRTHRYHLGHSVGLD